MKKITLAIFSFFALAACSEDVYHDIDKQNNGLETEGSVADLYFNYIPGSGSIDNSHEIVLETGVFPHLQKFPYTVGGSTYNYEVELITYSTPGPSMSVLSLKIIP